MTITKMLFSAAILNRFDKICSWETHSAKLIVTLCRVGIKPHSGLIDGMNNAVNGVMTGSPT
ncbi:protein of unknown function [Vibrio tapetis subsp. tapetis]|uniref:Uncharacterized protein n=1 Tax=Vibrio tapetis subsp. tapetis TaxID=1671868 RepID=A0A2N8Z8X2_9VIBR|nr:protein of unknown function [Vibrio tapetis subsp. tapetis]